MRILCLTARLPYPPTRGDRLRAFHHLETLSREHELHLVSFIECAAEKENAARLKKFCARVDVVPLPPWRSLCNAALNLGRGLPLQALYYRSAAMQRLVDQTLSENRFDAVYVHLFRMAQFVSRLRNVYRIVDLTDAISHEIAESMAFRGPFWRAVYALELPRIRHYERWLANRFDETWLISEVERSRLDRVSTEANIQVVPNGVDPACFHPLPGEPDPLTLLFAGHLGVPHNIDAARFLVKDVLPLVQQQVPGCQVRIVGAEPARSVRRLAQDPAVSVEGYIPDLNSCLNRTAVFVAPLRYCSGVQNKLLQAMAAGCPVVTSPCASLGLGARPGRDLLVGADAATMAGHVATLLRDREFRERIGRNGLEFAARNFTWDRVLQRMRVIEECRGASQESE